MGSIVTNNTKVLKCKVQRHCSKSNMGTGAEIASTCLRIGELISAAIVLGILSRFISRIHLGDGDVQNRLVYTEAWAVLSLAFSIILILPLTYSFFAFPLDLVMFIGWMVAFGLDYNLTSTNMCSSPWMWRYWGYYWGRFWYIPRREITRAVVGSTGCSYWQTLLAFAFIGGFCWFCSMLVGMYGIYSRRKERQNSWGRSQTASASVVEEKPEHDNGRLSSMEANANMTDGHGALQQSG